MSLSRGFPFVFNTINQTNACLKAHDNELNKLYADINAFLAANGHAHTGDGTDGAQIDYTDLANKPTIISSYNDLTDKPTATGIPTTPVGNLSSTNVQTSLTELDTEKLDTTQYRSFSRYSLLPTPAGFTFSIPVTIYDQGYGNYRISHSIWDFYPNSARKTYYIDPVNGLDTNDGKNPATSWKTLNKANTVTDCEVVICKGGIYTSLGSGNFFRPADRNMQFIFEEPSIFVNGFEGTFRTWTNLGGGYYSCSATLSLLGGVLDASVKDATYNNLFSRYTAKASVAEVAATPSSYYYDSGATTLYIHTFDGRQPDRDILVWATKRGMSASQANVTANRHWYFKNLTVVGGLNISSTDAAKKISVYADNCQFSFIDNDNGVSVTGNCFTYFNNCISEKNFLDGFNYHGTGALNAEGIEVNCIGRYNGLGNTTSINNGSTLHEDCKLIRINGLYHNNEGRNIHDINNAMSWNVGCFAFDSVAVSGAAKEDFAIWNNGKMWLYKCSAYGLSTVNAAALSPATMYTKGIDFTTTSGTLTPY